MDPFNVFVNVYEISHNFDTAYFTHSLICIGLGITGAQRGILVPAQMGPKTKPSKKGGISFVCIVFVRVCIYLCVACDTPCSFEHNGYLT